MNSTKPESVDHSLQCMEIWGGNSSVHQSLSTPGLDILLFSQPYEGASHGGDVYYASLCGGGKITRFILADISGHGETVSAIAKSLRNLMRKNINRKNQSRLVNSLNREFGLLAEMNRFATAIVATYLTTTDTFSICNAGHPRPLFFHNATGKWSILSPKEEPRELANLPLGILDEMYYTQFDLKLEKGDLLLFYTDALIEAENASGSPLGENGLVSLLNSRIGQRYSDIPANLLDDIRKFRGDRDADDDLSFILIHHNAGPSRSPGLRETFDVYSKLLRIKSV